MEESTKKYIYQAVIFTVTFIVAFFGTQYLFSDNDTVDAELKQIAKEMNANCPMRIDADTRLDNSMALGDKVLQYNYTLVNIVKEDPAFNTESVKKLATAHAKERLNANPIMKEYSEQDILLKYYYKDKNGNYLFDFVIKPEKR